MIIVGLDTSITCTGVARLQVPQALKVELSTVESKPPKSPGRDAKGKPLPPILQERAIRLATLAERIVESVGFADLVAIEGPSFSSKGSAVHQIAGLWWMVATRLHDSGVTVVEIPPSCRMKYATGKGIAPKDVVMLAAANRYRHLVEVTGNDVADALLIAAMCARYLGHPIEESLPAVNQTAIDKVQWPKGWGPA